MVLKDKRQITKNSRFSQSLGHAIQGIKRLTLEERNFKFDLIITGLMIMLGLALKLAVNDWLWLFAAIFSVVGSEVLNSIVENVVDLIVGPQFNELAKRAKDIAAGGVLLSALFAVIIGALVFIPQVIELFN